MQLSDDILIFLLNRHGMERTGLWDIKGSEGYICGYTIRDACTIRSAHALNYVVENVTVSLHYWYHACDETLDGQTAQLAAYFL